VRRSDRTTVLKQVAMAVAGLGPGGCGDAAERVSAADDDCETATSTNHANGLPIEERTAVRPQDNQGA
jgi:hypothetical protein